MSIREKMLELNYERVTSKILREQPKPKRIASSALQKQHVVIIKNLTSK